LLRHGTLLALIQFSGEHGADPAGPPCCRDHIRPSVGMITLAPE
jgi:hypothetical protein